MCVRWGNSGTKKLNNLSRITHPRSKHWQSGCKSVLAPTTSCSYLTMLLTEVPQWMRRPKCVRLSYTCTSMLSEIMGRLYKPASYSHYLWVIGMYAFFLSRHNFVSYTSYNFVCEAVQLSRKSTNNCKWIRRAVALQFNVAIRRLSLRVGDELQMPKEL